MSDILVAVFSDAEGTLVLDAMLLGLDVDTRFLLGLALGRGDMSVYSKMIQYAQYKGMSFHR